MKKLHLILLCLSLVSIAVMLLGNLVHAAPQGAWIKSPNNPVLEPGPKGSWDQNGVYRQTVIKDGTTYKMWYVGIDANWNTAIGYATSSDGVTWDKYAGNPVLTAGPSGSWDSRFISKPSVIKNGTTYEMWYYAYNDNWESAIGHATSPDGITWTKDSANPVLTTGPSGSWDSQRILFPSVIKNSTGYEMWYMGYDDNWNAAIGHATSPDGVTWTKDPANPVLEPGGDGAWDESLVAHPCVLYDSAAGIYRMWYLGCGRDGCAIGYAFSPDGVNWTKHSSNPVLRPGPSDSWDGNWVAFPAVLQSGVTYEMWYSASGAGGTIGIGRAVAAPGGWITGHVYNNTSAPLSGARIYALDDDLNIIAAAVAEADGSYAIVDLPTDDYYLEVNASGYGREYYDGSHDIAGATSVSVTALITTADVDFTLAPGGAISGHVYGPDGVTPFDGAMVEVKPAGGGRPLETISESDGAYKVDDLATGNYSAWAGHSSYLADAISTPVSVTQPDTTTGVDFTLLGPYFPLNVGDKWIYAWSNDTHHPGVIMETIQVTAKSGSYITLSAHHDQADGQFWIYEQADGLRWSGWSTQGGPSFPLPMYMLLYYAYVPTDFFKQPLSSGESWRGYGRTESSLPNHKGLSAVISVTETVTVTAGIYTNTLHIHTVISGTDNYLSGERDTWFAPGVGLIKLVYNHNDGSVTTAELVGGPYKYFIYLPLVMKSYQPPSSAFGDVIRTIPAPTSGAQGLAWDGSNLWVAWGDIYKVNPANGLVLDRIPGPADDIQGLTWDGSTLWCVSYATDYIYQLDPSDGTVLNSFPSPGSEPIGIAWDGAYLWHSDGNGIFYNLDPSDGSVVSSVLSPLGSSTTMLDWDGQYLWASMGGRFYQLDTSNWRTVKYIRVPAAFPKGIAWDGENLWNGGWSDDTLYLLDATPAGAMISGRVLKSGAPIAGKEMYIVKNSNTPDEMQVGWVTTDANGQYSFTVDPEVEYELRGFGDTSNKEFGEWVKRTTPTSESPNVTLPDVDIWYDGLLGPADGATFNRDQVSSGNPISFSWSAKAGATDYAVWLRQHDDWSYVLWNSPSSANTAVNFDGTTNCGIHLPALKYGWHVGMGLDSGWWAWSEHRILNITSTPLTITVDGYPGDWAASVPIATDAMGDNAGGPAGTDIGSIYSYVDDTDVYLLVKVHDPSIVYTATIELNLDYKPGKYGTWQSTADLHTNIWNGGISAWTGDMDPYPITGAEVAFGEAMEIRIPRDQLENTSYAIPTFVNIWVNGTGWDPSTIVP